MNSFEPDLIIEVTNLCDRQCHGCYAPNTINPDGAEFLDSLGLNSAVKKLPPSYRGNLNKVAIRGGEPSLHPNIGPLLSQIASELKLKRGALHFETHGRWNQETEEKLLPYLQDLGVVVKVSFDSMHEVKNEDLESRLSWLKKNDVAFKIAVTELTAELAAEQKATCMERMSFLIYDDFIFQAKATKTKSLVKPSFGIIKSNGEYAKELSSRFKELSVSASITLPTSTTTGEPAQVNWGPMAAFYISKNNSESFAV